MIKAGDYQPREIAKEKLLYVVISTHGDGDPPDEARGLYEFLGTKRAPQLPELQYSVLALGDTSYPKFCEAGRVVDERLAKLGAKRLLPRVDCDVDFEKLAQTWADDALARVREMQGQARARGRRCHRCRAPARRARRRPSPNSRARSRPPPKCWPTSASSGRGALREVRHVEARVPGPRQPLQARRRARHRASQSGFRPSTRCSQATKLDAAATVTHDGKTHTLLEWLRDERELTRIARPLLVQPWPNAARRICPSCSSRNAAGRSRSSRRPRRCPTCSRSIRRNGRRRRWSPRCVR